MAAPHENCQEQHHRAETDNTALVESSRYFLAYTLKREYFTFSNHKTTHPEKTGVH